MEKRRKHAPRGGLDRLVLQELVDEGLSIRAIAERVDRSPTTVRYWLDKHQIPRPTNPGRKRKHGCAADSAVRIISECSRHGSTTFALRSGGYYRCLQCSTEAVARWRRNAKLTLIEEAGGACLLCGYDEVPAALEFHHVDPREKSFGLAMRGLTRSMEKLRAEAEKCVLLCANCHAGVECGALQLPEDVVRAKLEKAADPE